jgi:hypothetical protein
MVRVLRGNVLFSELNRSIVEDAEREGPFFAVLGGILSTAQLEAGFEDMFARSH